MEDFFVNIYRFFLKKRFAFWLVFLSMLLLLTWGALKIDLEENITRFFPDDERVQKLSYIFQNSAFAERVVVMVSAKDTSETVSVDSLISRTEMLAERMERDLSPYSAKVVSKIDDEKVFRIFNTALQYLPVFLTKEDYSLLDSLTRPEVSRQVIRHNYQQLISPSGLALKKVIVNDPMGFSFLVLKKLQQLQYDDNFELYDNYIITKDHRHLVFFIQPGYSSNETGKNTGFVKSLDEITKEFSSRNEKILVSYFGSAAVAVGNAQQLRQDTILTLSLLTVLLSIFIYSFFRDWRVLALIFVPVLFGGLFALFCIFLLKGSVSILALAAGSVILGIAVNYALHFLVHQRNYSNKEEVIKDLVRPMTIGSLTTVLAFFSLQFTNAAVLKDIGLFAGFSLIGAALCSLIFLPHLSPVIHYRETLIERLSFFKKSPRPVWVFVILIITPIFFFFARDVKFNSDMSGLNFMSDETKQAQQRLEIINPASLHSLYVTSDAGSLEQALRENEKVSPKIDSLMSIGVVKRYHSPSSFLLSDSLQKMRIKQWKDFWTTRRKEAFYAAVKDEARKLKFSSTVLANIDSLVEKSYAVMDTASFNELKNIFFDGNIIQKNNTTTIISLINVLPHERENVHLALAGTPSNQLDRQMITKLFIEFVHDDFNFIVAFTSILVFVVLLISTGRLELTIITFMPMLITWIWILGIMALIGIEFNIVNVMVSTFIFGLGDDYSIFVMDGLLQEYKTGKQHLESVRTSIFLSALTTISGLGVLIFAEHPALRSIAAIAIIGIVCVFIMSQTVEPYLFRWLITDRTRKALPPMTTKGLIYTVMTYSVFVFGSFFLTGLGLILKAIPFFKRQVKLLYHSMIRFFTRMIIYMAFNLKKKIINESGDIFSRPAVIVANHSSFLDILLTAMLHPKVILLTNRWVWNSPIFGGVVRLADYYPVMEGAEDSVAKLKARVDEGYSIVVFPEGTRSKDGSIGRFHKGAFYIAEKLHLPVYPLLIHGVAEAIPKSTIYVNDGAITLKVLPAIEVHDSSFGPNYSARTKNISRFFKKEYAKLAIEELTPESIKFKLYNTYRYKGPVLEWYLRIKLKIENYYGIFHSLIPENASVLDLGCGYGFLCYSLQFLSQNRTITGVDYDEEKIAIADHSYLKSDRLEFLNCDINAFNFARYDVIIIADVLHYLEIPQQQKLLLKCFESLNAGGKIIIRDGDADLKQRHAGTKLTEFFSVRILKFNKSQNNLNFVSGKSLTDFAHKHNFVTETIDQGKLTSNVIFVMTKQA
jgi:1-acyl-sn-glycerol-3-phosphate acyltransferase